MANLQAKLAAGCNICKVISILTVYLYIYVHITYSLYLHDESITIMNK